MGGEGAAARAVGSYARREPEKTVLFEVVNQHLDSFARDARADGRGLPSFARAEPQRYLGCGILADGLARVWLDQPVDVATLPTWMRPQVATAARGDGALAEEPPRWLDEVNAPVDVASLPAWMRGPLAVAQVDTEERPLDLPETSVDVQHLPAWMRPRLPPAETRPRAWEELAEVESNASELPRWMQPAPVPQPRQRLATDDLAFGDEVDPAQLPTWMRASAPLRPYRHRPFDRPAPEESSQVPPQWGEDVDELPGEAADLDSVVDLARLPHWMKSQGYVPIQPTLNSRSRPRVNSEGESTRLWQTEWDRPRPAPLEPDSQVLVEPQFAASPPHDAHRWASPFARPAALSAATGPSGRVWPMPIDGPAVSPGQSLPWGEADCVDAAASDLPAEVDLEALPRWMRAGARASRGAGVRGRARAGGGLGLIPPTGTGMGRSGSGAGWWAFYAVFVG